MSSQTFQVSQVTTTKVKVGSQSYSDFLIRAIPALTPPPSYGRAQKSSAPELLKATEAPNGRVSSRFQNGFVAAAFAAYSYHHHLIISPDDVWIAITTALARYINAHAEAMRHIFVNHQGSKPLEVRAGGTLHSVNWDGLIAQMSEQIAENTNAEIQKWVEPDFSTTTELIRTVGSIVLMGAMQKYFSYKFSLCCGLPGVTMLGTLEDWQNIRQRIDRLLDWNQKELTDWHAVLVPILEEFIRSYSGNVNKDFWNRIATETGGGSGPTYLTGWILAFIPWNDSDHYILRNAESIAQDNRYGQVDTNDVPTSAVSVPVIIDDNGAQYNTTFFAGHLYATVGSSPDSIQPYLGWVMIHNK